MKASFVILMAVFAAIACAFALTARADADDACVVTPGLYQTTWERAAVSLVNNPALSSNSHMDIYGDITLKIDCDGTITIQNPDTQGVWNFATYSRIPGGKPIDHRTAAANVPFHFKPVGKAMKGPQGFPTVVLSVTNENVCPNGTQSMFCINAHTELWTLVGTADDSSAKNKIVSGHGAFNSASSANHSNIPPNFVYVISHSDAAYPPFSDMAGNHVGSTDGFSMVMASKPPTLTVTQDLEDVFFENTPSVMLTFRAYVDSWGTAGATGSKVHFQFENQQTDVPIGNMKNGNVAEWTVEVGKNLSVGKHTVTATATSANNMTGTATHTVSIIPVPPWTAKLTGWKADGLGCQSGCEMYSGTKNVPEKPVALGIVIPDIVPVVGGLWGLQSTQFHITPKPLSRVNGKDPGDAPSGGGSFGLAGHVINFPARTDSLLFTKTTENELQLTDADIRFDVAETSFTKHIGLTSIIGSLGDLTGIKGLGDWIRSADVAGVDATILAGMEGSRVELTAKPTDQDMKITKFVTQLDLGVQAVLGINAQLVGGEAIGNVSGALNLSFAPAPKIDNCKISFIAYVIYGFPIFGKFYQYPAFPQWTDITKCNASTAYQSPLERLTNTLAAANSVPFIARAEAATPPAEATLIARDATVTDKLANTTSTQGVPKGRQATTLVAGAPVTAAAPAIASGPGGRLALVWIGENLQKARPQSFQARLRLFDGHAWSETAPFIGDGAHPDALPSVAFDGNGNVVAAWSVDATPNLSATTPAATQANNLRIEVVVCDGKTGAVKSRKTLSTGAGANAFVHAVAASDGSVWVAWQNVAGSDYATMDAPVRIMAAHWDRTSFSAPEIAANATGVQAWQLAARDGATAMLAVDTTAGGKRAVHVLERANNAWKETFGKSAAAAIDARIAAGFDASGKANALWADGNALLRESGGAVTTVAPAAGGFPVAAAFDANAISTLVRTTGGYVSLLTDAHTGKTGAPVPMSALASSLSSPGVARAGSDWLLAAAPVTIVPGHAPALGGVALTLTSAKH